MAALTSTFLPKSTVYPPSQASPKAPPRGRDGRGGHVEITCRKKDLHPEFHEDAKVYCNGEQVMTTGGTQKEYVVDVWSGNHPFYLGNRSAVLKDADQVEKFRKKFAGMPQEMMEIPTLKGEIVLPTKKKGAGGKGGKKK